MLQPPLNGEMICSPQEDGGAGTEAAAPDAPTDEGGDGDSGASDVADAGASDG
jgi:hypothetical protein